MRESPSCIVVSGEEHACAGSLGAQERGVSECSTVDEVRVDGAQCIGEAQAIARFLGDEENGLGSIQGEGQSRGTWVASALDGRRSDETRRWTKVKRRKKARSAYTFALQPGFGVRVSIKTD
jgi:hypothetical protein